MSISRIERGKQTPRPATELRLLAPLGEVLDLPTRSDDPAQWRAVEEYLDDEIPLDDLLTFLDFKLVLAVLIEKGGRPTPISRLRSLPPEALIQRIKELHVDTQQMIVDALTSEVG